ncbi:hypothetical protein J3Q64DRAFT_1630537, partial [Phycomyces blakesleeanus]
CRSCKQEDHSTSRSYECPNHIPSKRKEFSNNLGFSYKALMRKFSLNTVVNKEYKMLLRNKILITSNDLHNSISREIMFINSYCLPSSHDSIPNSIYKQTFRYLVLQSGTSQCLSEACTELATCYTKHIVENFEKQSLSFFFTTHCKKY